MPEFNVDPWVDRVARSLAAADEKLFPSSERQWRKEATRAVYDLLPLLTSTLAEARQQERAKVYAEQEAEGAEFMANLKSGQIRLGSPSPPAA